MTSWRAPGSILEAPGLNFRWFWDAQVAPGLPQGLQIPCKMLTKTTVFERSNLNAQKLRLWHVPLCLSSKGLAKVGRRRCAPLGAFNGIGKNLKKIRWGYGQEAVLT